MRLLAVVVLAGMLSGTAAAAPGEPARKHTTADTARAQRALLVRADLGKGWVARPGPKGQTTLTCPSFRPDLAGVVETGAAASPNFRSSDGGGFVAQTAYVFRTARQAATLWRRVAGAGYLRCLVDTVAGASTQGLTFTVTRRGELDVPALAARTRGYRVIARAATSGKTLTTYFDTFLLASGRTVTQLSFAQFGAPVPSAIELLLGRTVAKRMGAAGAA